jgi:hypothetical protein
MAISTKKKRVPAKKVLPAQWNEKRRTLFLEELALTSNAAASERAAEMAPGSAYRERRKSADFRAAWDEALAEGYTRLEFALLERAIEGTIKSSKKLDDGSTEVREISDRLGMALLAAHRASVMAVRARVADPEDARAWLAAKLAEMNRKDGGNG